MVKNKVQPVILDVTKVIPNYPKEIKYDFYDKQDEHDRLRRIDFSLANINLEQIIPTSEFCSCGSCKGHNRLLTWPKRSRLVFGIEGACPFSVGIQIVRINLLRNRESDPNILSKLLNKSRDIK